jgi:hypothetical protein
MDRSPVAFADHVPERASEAAREIDEGLRFVCKSFGASVTNPSDPADDGPSPRLLFSERIRIMSFPSRLGLSLSLVLVATACGSGGELLSVGRDAIKADGGGDDGGGGSADGGATCTSAADCGPDAVCGFPAGATCNAVGACFSTKGIEVCNAYSPGCACDGTTINVICEPVPSGYTTKPILHPGKCAAGEGGPCTTDTDCSNGICGFPRVDACTAKGVCFPKPEAECDGLSAGCACDGTFINMICNGLPSTHAPKPFLHAGACTDGG